MADEIQTPPHDPDEFAPTEGWPRGMFPSPIVDEHFDPYTNPQDKLDYLRMGGSRDYILQRATLEAQRRMAGEPGSYPDHAEMIERAVSMVEEHKKRQRVEGAFKRRQP